MGMAELTNSRIDREIDTKNLTASNTHGFRLELPIGDRAAHAAYAIRPGGQAEPIAPVSARRYVRQVAAVPEENERDMRGRLITRLLRDANRRDRSARHDASQRSDTGARLSPDPGDQSDAREQDDQTHQDTR